MIKLSKRERTLIYIVTLLLLMVVAVKYVLAPTTDRMLAMEDEIATKESNTIEYRSAIGGVSMLESEIAQLQKDVAAQSDDFYELMPNEGLDELLQSYIKKYDLVCNVGGGSIALNNAAMVDITSYDNETLASIYCGTVSITGAGALSDVVEFAGHFSQEPAIRMTSFQLSPGGGFSAVFDVYMYEQQA